MEDVTETRKPDTQETATSSNNSYAEEPVVTEPEDPTRSEATGLSRTRPTEPETRPEQATERPTGEFRFSHDAELESRHILNEDWDVPYYASAHWAEGWDTTRDPERKDWPEEVKVCEGKMYWREQLCVPEDLNGRVIRAHHAEIGHIGGDRLLQEMQRWCVFAPGSNAKKKAK